MLEKTTKALSVKNSTLQRKKDALEKAVDDIERARKVYR